MWLSLLAWLLLSSAHAQGGAAGVPAIPQSVAGMPVTGANSVETLASHEIFAFQFSRIPLTELGGGLVARALRDAKPGTFLVPDAYEPDRAHEVSYFGDNAGDDTLLTMKMPYGKKPAQCHLITIHTSKDKDGQLFVSDNLPRYDSNQYYSALLFHDHNLAGLFRRQIISLIRYFEKNQ